MLGCAGAYIKLMINPSFFGLPFQVRLIIEFKIIFLGCWEFDKPEAYQV